MCNNKTSHELESDHLGQPDKMIQTNVHDERHNSSIQPEWGQNDKLKVHGIMWPLPNAGDFIVTTSLYIYKFIEVKNMGNPRDGFKAKLEDAGCHIDKNDPSPTAKQIIDFMKSDELSVEIVQ